MVERTAERTLTMQPHRYNFQVPLTDLTLLHRWLERNMRVCMGNKVFETLDEINELKAIKVINKV